MILIQIDMLNNYLSSYLPFEYMTLKVKKY